MRFLPAERTALFPLLVLGGLLLAAAGPRAVFSQPADSLMEQSPLKPCPPDTANCIHERRFYGLEPTAVFAALESTLESMEPVRTRTFPDEHRATSVFRVWFFRDDVEIQIENWEGGSMLFIRSASRIGYSDFGVNSRRVRRFFDRLDKTLKGLEVGG